MTKGREGAIGITRMKIKAGETIASIDLLTLKVTSNNLKFLPWGKTKLLKLFMKRRTA